MTSAAGDGAPFQFRARLNMTLLTGRCARDLVELVSHMRTVPGSVIYHHTHHFLVQHQFLSPEPPNDFAYWVSNILLEDRLGEEMAAVDVLRFSTIRQLRDAMVEMIEHYLDTSSNLRSAPPGEEFHFMNSVSFVIPTEITAQTLLEFRQALERISLNSISYHMFDARLRLEQHDNDFSKWLDQSLGEAQLAHALRKLDPYTYTEDGLRRRIMALTDARLRETARG